MKIEPVDVVRYEELRPLMESYFNQVPSNERYDGIRNMLHVQWLMGSKVRPQIVEKWIKAIYPPTSTTASLAIRKLFRLHGYRIDFEVSGTRLVKRMKKSKYHDSRLLDINEGFPFDKDISTLHDDQYQWVANHARVNLQRLPKTQ